MIQLLAGARSHCPTLPIAPTRCHASRWRSAAAVVAACDTVAGHTRSGCVSIASLSSPCEVLSSWFTAAVTPTKIPSRDHMLYMYGHCMALPVSRLRATPSYATIVWHSAVRFRNGFHVACNVHGADADCCGEACGGVLPHLGCGGLERRHDGAVQADSVPWTTHLQVMHTHKHTNTYTEKGHSTEHAEVAAGRL